MAELLDHLLEKNLILCPICNSPMEKSHQAKDEFGWHWVLRCLKEREHVARPGKVEIG